MPRVDQPGADAMGKMPCQAQQRDAMNIMATVELRNSREEMTRLALLYPQGLRVGSFVTADASFSTQAYRFEDAGLSSAQTAHDFTVSNSGTNITKLAQNGLTAEADGWLCLVLNTLPAGEYTAQLRWIVVIGN